LKNGQFVGLFKNAQIQGARKSVGRATMRVVKDYGCSGKHRRWVLFNNLICLTFGMLAIMHGHAFAASQTFNGIFHQPVIGPSSYSMLSGSESLYAKQFLVGMHHSYAFKPMQVKSSNFRARGVIDHLLVSDLTAAVGIMPWLQLGIDMPFVLYNSFKSPLDRSTTSLNTQIDVGDLRIELKSKLLGACKSPIGVALMPFITVPTGSDTHYTGDAGITGGMKAALDIYPHSKLGIAVNLGFRTGKKVSIQNINYQHLLSLGAGVSGQLSQAWHVAAEVNAMTSVNDKFFRDRDLAPAEALISAAYDIKKLGLSMVAGAGTCLVCGVKGAKVRGNLGLSYRFMTNEFKTKAQADAFTCQLKFSPQMNYVELQDLKTNCPDDPNHYNKSVHEESCLKYYELRDLSDLVLRCPADENQFDPARHDAACPKVFQLSDNFSMSEIHSIYTLSVSEMEMRCPDNAADFRHEYHDTACPKYYDLKTAISMVDECPANADNYVHGVDSASCPKFYVLRDNYGDQQWMAMMELAKLDTDADGINDYLDKCPRIKETINNFADQDGCPETGKGVVSGGEIKTIQPVYFGFNSASLNNAAKEGISQVVDTVNKNTWIQEIRVGGNADAVGSFSANQIISKHRARIVIQYMKKMNVRANVKLTPISYGASNPIASNDTETGRALNRRVIFNVAGYRYQNYQPPLSGAHHVPRAKKIRAEEKPIVASSYESPDKKPALPKEMSKSKTSDTTKPSLKENSKDTPNDTTSKDSQKEVIHSSYETPVYPY